MQALTELLQGIAVTHLSLLVFFLIGAAAFPWCEWDLQGWSAARLMARVACTCALGLSIVGLALFVLGLFGWLTVGGITIALLVLFAAGCAAWRASPLRAAYWRPRLYVLTRCWNWPLAFVYGLLLIIGSRAVIPDATGYSDAIYYHLAYAQDWANAGRITVDPFLFFPFYANNFVLFYTAWIVLGAGIVVQFMTWLTGLLAALAIFASVAEYGETLRARGWAIVTVGLLTVLSVISTAIFLDYAVLGYIDVPIGAMALFAIVAILAGIRDKQPAWMVAAAVIAGFLVGMKASFLLLVPIFAIALIWGCAAIRMPWRSIALVVVLLGAVGAPWYVRNLILAGDPIPPTLNMMFYGHDGIWKTTEWDGIWKDMRTTKSPRALATLPVRAFLHPESSDFREYGASGLILFLYVPPLVMLALLLYRRRVPAQVGIPIVTLTLFILYWFVTSSLLRYALLLYPLLAAIVGMLLLELVVRRPRWAAAAVLLALIAAMPNVWNVKVNRQFTRNDLLGDLHLLLHYKGNHQYLMANDDGYPEEQVTIAWMRRHGYKGRVYVISDNSFDYYFRRAGVTSIGTWVGPAGYFRLMEALDAGEAPAFLNSLGTHAVLFSPQQLIDANFERLLARQLRRAGYRPIALAPGSAYHLYVRG